MKYKSIRLLLWAIFAMLSALYLLNFGSNFWDILSLCLFGAAIVLAVCSWIVAYISEE